MLGHLIVSCVCCHAGGPGGPGNAGGNAGVGNAGGGANGASSIVSGVANDVTGDVKQFADESEQLVGDTVSNLGAGRRLLQSGVAALQTA